MHRRPGRVCSSASSQGRWFAETSPREVPGTRTFITGRPHIRAKVKKHLAGQVMSISPGPNKDDIIGYIRVRLDEDETPEAMDESLKVHILEMIFPKKCRKCMQGDDARNSAHTQAFQWAEIFKAGLVRWARLSRKIGVWQGLSEPNEQARP